MPRSRRSPHAPGCRCGPSSPPRSTMIQPRSTKRWPGWRPGSGRRRHSGGSRSRPRRRRWTRSFRWGYDERPRHNSRTDRVLDLLQRNSTGGIFNRHGYNLSYVSRSESALAPAEIKARVTGLWKEHEGSDFVWASLLLCLNLSHRRRKACGRKLTSVFGIGPNATRWCIGVNSWKGIGYQVCDRKSRPGLLSTAKTAGAVDRRAAGCTREIGSAVGRPAEADRAGGVRGGWHVVENLPASSGSVRTRRDGALASTRGKASAIRYVTESPGLDCFQLPRPRAQLTDEQLDALEKLVLQLGGRQKRIAPAASEAVVDVAPAESEPDSSPKDWL